MRTHQNRRRAGLLGLLPLIGLFLRTAEAGSATWNIDPVSNDWNDALNWIPNTVPNSEEDLATFDVSDTSAVNISSTGDTVDHIVFTSVATAYTLTVGPKSSILDVPPVGMISH